MLSSGTNCEALVLNDQNEEPVIECATKVFPKTGGEKILKHCSTKRNRNN